jgi:hypothetical protein
MQKITPFLWFDHEVEETEFDIAAFPRAYDGA